MKPLLFTLLLCLAGLSDVQAASRDEVLDTYANIAFAVYSDSAAAARVMQGEIDAFLAAPSPESLAAARAAWIEARVPYQQSEVFRFGNAVVDDWEGQVNAWPLDEGLIDYVGERYDPQLGNPGARLNIVANASVTLGRSTLDLDTLTPALLAGLNELAGSEANVATGYHAIEFLLWGQDQNGTGAGAGTRPYTDYLTGDGCTHGHCARRADYLRAVATLLVDDLTWMARQWQPGVDDNYRSTLLSLDGNEGLVRMIFGMGSLALGELAGQRMKVALEANSPEDEHDCFSDNTHWSHYYDARGIRNVYLGAYRRVDGELVSGPSLSELVAARDPAVDAAVRETLDSTDEAMDALVRQAETGMKFDQMIAPGNAAGHALIDRAIDALVAETEALTVAARTLGIDKLNPDNAGRGD